MADAAPLTCCEATQLLRTIKRYRELLEIGKRQTEGRFDEGIEALFGHPTWHGIRLMLGDFARVYKDLEPAVIKVLARTLPPGQYACAHSVVVDRPTPKSRSRLRQLLGAVRSA